MAPPSPRRSSRARATNSQPLQPSSSSGASGRSERSTRLANKPSSDKSTPRLSLSSEPLDDFDDTLLGRRRKRGQIDDTDQKLRVDTLDMVNGSDDMQEDEDEAVRCLCGSEDYPGPPPVDGPDADIFAAIELTDEVTGFFVQCDVCKVWQHGACVGIFSAESSPDEYFCEQCRKDLHKMHVAANGQKYSKYLPLNRQSRTTSRATSIAKDDKSGSKSSRPSTATQSLKRRSTMNSRDAAYDDEQLRRAIEASKGEGGQDALDLLLTRRAKRGRSDSEENNNLSVKRQRTRSQSASPPIEKAESVDGDASDDEMEGRNGSKKSKSNRHQRERSEKEDKDRQRLEAASKRKGRAERRRADESEILQETALVTAKSAQQRPAESPRKEDSPSLAPAPDTPPTSHPISGSSHKRGARSSRRAKGKNQYTKDRDRDEGSPARSSSKDMQKADEATTTGHPKLSANDHKTSKAKANMANKMSMLDMKRRVAAIMEFISRTQVDLAAEAPLSQGSSGRETPQEKPETAHTSGESEAPEASDSSRFKGLNCIEMMDVLTRDMVRWQNQYA
ncbi:hypothetical protein E4U30_004450 [Claviceps sp. LM220 group G6]|nr:hypothetical protein E4U15_000762 [Claviceps sp. LM218 group G6]KAG6093308.1 hypothetical protein E4U30_004450 [Claviceps sp. LM220 group G6]KAG6107850.1 hypothetical protein E4U31_008144 [Claviceps sp. LM219 group G6]